MMVIDRNANLVSGVSEDKSERIPFFEYLYVFVLIIYAGLASSFVRSFTFDRPVSMLLPITLGVILAIKNRVVFTKQFYLLIFGIVIYLFVTTVKYSELHPRFFANLIMDITVAYITIKALKFRLFIIFEQLMYYLAAFSLFMWVVQIVMGGDNLLILMARIPSIDTFSFVSGGGLNMIIYSAQPSTFMREGYSIIRNCGFAWEPGGFAVYLALAIYINLFFIKTDVKFNNRFWVLVLALASTQSTTGYVILLIILLAFFFQTNMKMMLLFLPVIILVIVLLFSLPFMRDKIMKYYQEALQADLVVEQSVGAEYTQNPQRFASFVIAIQDFIENPVFGYGGHLEDRWFTKINANIAPISGIGNFLAQYGLVGFLVFTTFLAKTSRGFSSHFNYNGKYLFFLMLFLISISYSIIFVVLIMSFWMFAFFENYGSSEAESND